MTIRVLCVFGYLDRGGAETMCMNLYRKLDKDKIQFDFVKHTNKKCDFDDEIRELGGRIYEAPRLQVSNYFIYKKWWIEHFKNHPEHKIVHAHMYTTAPIYLRIAQQSDRSTICHAHSTSYDEDFLRTLVWKATRRSLLKCTDYCLACSEAAGNYMFPGREFKVLKNAIDLKKFAFSETTRKKRRDELGLSSGDKAVIIVANFVAPKNPVGVINLFDDMHKTIPNIRLFWAGQGPLRTDVETRISELSLESCINLLGVRSDIPELLQAADLFMLPSTFEGLPVAAIEAQAAGLPCLLSDGISRETGLTENCRFVSINDAKSWSIAARELLGLPRTDASETITSAGYNIDETVNWVTNLYSSIYKDAIEREALSESLQIIG